MPPFDLQRLNSGGSLTVTRPTLAHFLLTTEERRWRATEVFDAVSAGRLKERGGVWTLSGVPSQMQVPRASTSTWSQSASSMRGMPASRVSAIAT